MMTRMMMLMMLMLMELKLLRIKVTSRSFWKPRLIYWVTVVSSLVNQPTSARSFFGVGGFPTLLILHGEYPRLKIPPHFWDGENIHSNFSKNQTYRRASDFIFQELVHWAGTVCVGRGELEITFEELLDAMHASRQ